jgi:hypothetical protein
MEANKKSKKTVKNAKVPQKGKKKDLSSGESNPGLLRVV